MSQAMHTIHSSDQVSGIKCTLSPTRVGLKSPGQQESDPGPVALTTVLPASILMPRAFKMEGWWVFPI